MAHAEHRAAVVQQPRRAVGARDDGRRQRLVLEPRQRPPEQWPPPKEAAAELLAARGHLAAKAAPAEGRRHEALLPHELQPLLRRVLRLHQLDKGAEVDRARKDGATPLYIACQNRHVDAARLLLDNGAAVDQTREYGSEVTTLVTTSGAASRGN